MVSLLPRVASGPFSADEVTDDAIDYVAANLREQDAEEMYATTGNHQHAGAIRAALAGSDDAVVFVNAYGEPVAVMGVSTVSFLYNTGCPWMLATPAVLRHRRALISLGRTYTQAMLQHYDVLANHVDERNSISVAWLQHIGYVMSKPEPYGALGLPFHKFQIAR